MGYAAKAVSDHKHKELHPDEIFSLFKSTFENVVEPYSISEVHFQQKEDGIVTRVTSTFRGKTIVTEASGNGRLDGVSNALKKAYELKYTLETYQEHALERVLPPRLSLMWESVNRMERLPGERVLIRISSVPLLMHW